ncbi:MAG: hypothetical protein JJ896_12445 [Rhodothermales bacterium]|nr:hypothetical protein [Rhodothermales bacterium]MBO6780455.1 hypothetical protein [Rhodothermales bacterium]
MRIILLIALAILAFGGSFVGVYMSIEPTEEPAELIVPDSLDVGALTDSLNRDAWGASLEAQSQITSKLVDSLAIAKGELLAAISRADDLQIEVDRLKELLRNKTSREEIAAAMASTLPKLDTAELSPILEGLDDTSLDDLYNAASSRNRTTILQALKPDRASALVERFIAGPGQTPVATPSQPDSTQ